MKNEIVVGSVLKRVLSSVMDALIIFVVLVLLQNWVVIPLSNSACGLDKKESEYKQVLLDSKMFVEYNEGIYQLDSDVIYDASEKKSVFQDEEISSYDFYEPYFDYFLTTDYASNTVSDDDKDKTNNPTFSEEFNKAKEESAVFTLNDGVYTVAADADNVSVQEFYLTQYEKAYEAIYDSSTRANELASVINAINMTGLIINMSVVVLIFTLVIPLCMKNGETLGKLIAGLGVVSKKDGFRIRKSQTIIRFIAFVSLELLLGFALAQLLVILIILPVMISFTFVAFTKGHYAIHDYCAMTIVVDKSRCVIYKDIEEFKSNLEQIRINEERDAYYVGQKTKSEQEIDDSQNGTEGN